MKIRFSVVPFLFFVSIQPRAAAAVHCAGATPSTANVIYVSPQGKDDTLCGQSTSSPCQTIQQGITNCKGESCGVLVRHGIYDTNGIPINIANGVSLYGSCAFDESLYRYRSTIIGNPAIQAKGIDKETVLDGFVILGSAAAAGGGPSVALTVSNSSRLVLRRNVIASGPGGKGAKPATPAAAAGQTGRMANSTTGGAGGVACASNPPAGGVGTGGKGADLRPVSSDCVFFTRLCSCSDRKEAPRPWGQNGANSGSVLGGAGGGPGSAGCACGTADNAGTGSSGASGKMGDAGKLGGSPNPDRKGSFAGTTWRPNFGGTGALGQVGSGGGGAGAGGFAALYTSGTNINGFAGGGGGGGGCGGPGGTGGQQGGASVPLVLFTSSVVGVSDSNAVIPGPGGQGGEGGTGARGGSGGSGGFGFLGQQYVYSVTIAGIDICRGTVPGMGGRGGDGGQGGAGAGGAGGNGGPSFGIALVNSSPLSPHDFIIYSAQPGRGGDPGPGGQNDAANKGVIGEAGATGFSDDIVSFTSASLPVGDSQ